MPNPPQPDATPQFGMADPADVARLQAELALAREQLAFYAGFDAAIRENVARAAELLREAEAARRDAARLETAARAEAERLRAERAAWQAAVAAQVAATRSGLDDLARLLAGDGMAAEQAEFDRDGDADTGGAGVAADSVAVLEPSAPSVAADVPVATAIIVHGVPDVPTAQALQWRLAGIGALDRVVTRQFLAGVARYDAVGRGLVAGDLDRWQAEGGPAPVAVRPGLVELAYPGALPG